jgi:MoaA/NifB/PqqE/SkfB family radical SAM enzyme
MLSFYQTEQIIKNLKDLKMVVIEGGEPTMWPFILQFIKDIKCDNIVIITNGYDVSRVIQLAADLWEQKRVRWLVSLNGIAEMHDKSRGKIGAYNNAVETIKLLKSHGYRVRTSYVPFLQNYNQYKAVKGLSKSIADGMNLCYPVGTAKFGENMKWRRPPEFMVMDLEREQMQDSKYLNKLAFKRFLKKVTNRELMPCLAAKSMIHINPDGIIRPCPFDELMLIGWVIDNDFFISDTTRQYLRSEKIPHKCQYQSGTICNDCYLLYTQRRMLL